MKRLLIAALASALGFSFAAVALAGKAGPAEPIVQNTCCLAYGDTITFTPYAADATTCPNVVSTPGGTFEFSDIPACGDTRIVVDCFQGKGLVYEATSTEPWSGIYALTLNQAGDMRTIYAKGKGLQWLGGAASCTAESGYLTSASRFIVTASLAFDVSA
jgi:hypothetical protein